MGFLNGWWFFGKISKESENEQIRSELKSEIQDLLFQTTRRFDNLIIEFENNSEISKKIRQKYNEFKEFDSHIGRERNGDLCFRNNEEDINTMRKCISILEGKFDGFLSTYENYNTIEEKRKNNNNDSISELCESYGFSESNTTTKNTNDSGQKETNYFKKEENQELGKSLLKIGDDMGLRGINGETNFFQETKAFKNEIKLLSNYPKMITFMCRDKGFDFNSEEVQHLVRCYKTGKKIILDNKDFFSQGNGDLEKSKKIIDELNEVSFELFDEGFYEDLLYEFDKTYGRIEDVEGFELIEEAKNL